LPIRDNQDGDRTVRFWRRIVPSEHAENAAQREADHHRWGDDGGFIPETELPRTPAPTRSPWREIGIATAVGFAIGWLTSPRGGR
jgi:hypothetical protein